LAAENLANTNKELKAIGDLEMTLGAGSIPMVNGTLMAKGGRYPSKEAVGPTALVGDR
jgi:hypothetical protein